VTSAVHPELGTDVVASTLDWLLTRARSMLREQGDDLPGVLGGVLGARCAATDQARLTMLTEAGFEVVCWHQDMVRSVTPPVPAAPPPGLAIVRYDPRYTEAARIAHNDAYADDPGALLPDAASWPQHAVGLASFLPTLRSSPWPIPRQARRWPDSCSAWTAGPRDCCTASAPGSRGASEAWLPP
jgi:mycothiol synthase